MGIVWAVIVTALGGLFVFVLGCLFLTLAIVGHHSDRGARNSGALVLGESVATLLYASLIGVIITACWFPDLYLHYAKPHVWWFLGIFVVGLLVGRMIGGSISKGIRQELFCFRDLELEIVACGDIARVLPILAFEALMLVAFIMVWVAPFCV